MLQFKVDGMTCGHCVGAVTRAAKSIDPHAEVQVDLGSGTVRVRGDASPEALLAAFREAGYPAAPMEAPSSAVAAKSAGCCCGR